MCPQLITWLLAHSADVRAQAPLAVLLAQPTRSAAELKSCVELLIANGADVNELHPGSKSVCNASSLACFDRAFVC